MFTDSGKISRVLLFLALTIPAISLTQERATRELPAAGSDKDKLAMVQQDQKEQAIKSVGDGPIVNADQNPALGPVDPFVIAGGGGTSAGTSFALDGTIGQQVAVSPLNGGGFSITSGFWPSAGNVVAPRKRRGQLTSQ